MPCSAPRHFLDLPDIAPRTLRQIIDKAQDLKSAKFEPPQLFSGLSLAMIFDKRSTRTRISFEVAMKQLGGHTIVMNMEEIQLSGAESLTDTANVLSRLVDGVMVRMSDHTTLAALADYASIPIINGLTDHSHPCQIMADVLTMQEKLGRLEGLKVAWMGDYNNVARTHAQATGIFGYHLHIAAPQSLLPEAEHFGDAVTFTTDPLKVVENADVVMTDTWVSMGQEGGEDKLRQLEPYQVNPALMSHAKEGALFMHCMPIHRGEEVTDSVADSPASAIYDTAENRLHAQKAILAWCLEETGVKV